MVRKSAVVDDGNETGVPTSTARTSHREWGSRQGNQRDAGGKRKTSSTLTTTGVTESDSQIGADRPGSVSADSAAGTPSLVAAATVASPHRMEIDHQGDEKANNWDDAGPLSIVPALNGRVPE